MPKLGNSSHLGNGHRLYPTSVRDVRPDTKIDHRSTAVDSGRSAIRNLSVNHVQLEVVVLLASHM